MTANTSVSAPGSARFDATALTRLRRVAGTSVSPCGRFLALGAQRLDKDEAAYVSDIWRVELDKPGTATALTRGGSNDSAPCYRADGALGFSSNRNPRDGEPEKGDDERKQVWVLPAGGGEPQPVTDEALGVGKFRYARRAPVLVLMADVLPGVGADQQRARFSELKKHGPTGLTFERMPVRYWDYWWPRAKPHLIAYVAGERRDLTPDAGDEHLEADWDVAADGSRVVVMRRQGLAKDGIEDWSLLSIEVASGRRRELGKAALNAYWQPAFSPDGQRVACIRSERRAGHALQPKLWLFDVEGNDVQGRAIADWDVWPSELVWTPDSKALIVTAEVRGQVPVYRVDIETGAVERITATRAGGTHSSLLVLPGGESVVGLRHTFTQPPEPFRVPLAAESDIEKLANVSGFEAELGATIARIETFDVSAPDGEKVQSYLLTPREGRAPHPLLLWVHGGPHNAWADGWHWRWNSLVPCAAGYAVLLPNPRGSTGFGQAFTEGVWNNEWGGACYADLMAVTDAACQKPDIDARRTVAMGGSFGGYMANWIAGNTDRFRCLVTHAGIYHFAAFHGTTDHPAYFAYSMGATPDSDPSAFERYSPHSRLAAWRTPTLVIHGERDYRVPISEALLLFEALQRRGVESKLVVFPDENHWIMRPRNTIHWYAAWMDFVAAHLARRA